MASGPEQNLCRFLGEISLKAKLSIIIVDCTWHKKHAKMLSQILLNKVWNYNSNMLPKCIDRILISQIWLPSKWLNTAGNFLENVSVTMYTFIEYILSFLPKCLGELINTCILHQIKVRRQN